MIPLFHHTAYYDKQDMALVRLAILST